MQWKNAEGYVDTTAAVAMQHTARKERMERKGMAKRSCRRSVDESKVHEKAVKIRKMTDPQLIEYIENRVEKARSEGRNEVKKSGSLKTFLQSIKVPGVIPGVGRTTVDKIIKHAEEGGFLG